MAQVQPLAMRPNQAAAYIGLSRTLLYSLLQSGELPSVKCGAARLIPTAALQAWLERQLTAAGQH